MAAGDLSSNSSHNVMKRDRQARASDSISEATGLRGGRQGEEDDNNNGNRHTHTQRR